MAAPSPYALEMRAEVHRANQETGEAAVYVSPDGVGVYDPETGTTGGPPGASYPCVATMGESGTTRREGTTIQMDDRLAVVTGLPDGLEVQEGGRLTLSVEDLAVVAVERHAIGGATVSHTVRLRDA